MDPSIAVRVGRKSVSSRSSLRLNETASSFLGGRFSVLEPCDAKVSCTVLRGLGDRKVARLLGASPRDTISELNPRGLVSSLSTLRTHQSPSEWQDSLLTCLLDFGQAGFAPAGL
jgi:hypothetical protein